MIKVIHQRFLLCTLVLLFLFGMSGCDKTKIVLTTGFGENEIFRIDTAVCKKSEIMVYLTNIQNGYEKVYGEEIWNTPLQEGTLEDSVKETVLARIARVKVMNLMAAANGVVLSEAEESLVQEAGEAYYGSLNDTEILMMEVSEEDIIGLYREYALANKVYEYLIQDVNPEISDDEARTITVQHILIKTYRMDENGNRIPYSEAAKKEAYRRAGDVLLLAKEGTDFSQLIREYNEDSKSEYSFRKGEVDVAYENAAFHLGTDEISDIVETEYGYHIIRCISTFNREETDANKIKIVKERKKEAFTAEYEQFLSGLTKNINTKEWDLITMIHDPNVITTDFFDNYETYFSDES